MSRLTVRPSDDELSSSDSENSQNSQGFVSLQSLQRELPNLEVKSGKCTPVNHVNQSAVPNGLSLDSAKASPRPPGKPAAAAKKQNNRRRKAKNRRAINQQDSQSGQNSFCSSSDDEAVILEKRQQPLRTDFDSILRYIDGTAVTEWLNKCNSVVAEMTTWCHQHDNFVKFAHFWLTDFPDIQRSEIFRLEYSIIVDHVEYAFSAGISRGFVKKKDVNDLLAAVFREYPRKMLSSAGTFMFLEYLEILTSERKEEYRKLLTDVKCSTKIKQHAQWTLAVRALALVNVWSAIINFYRTLLDSSQSSEVVNLSTIARVDPNPTRVYQAIR